MKIKPTVGRIIHFRPAPHEHIDWDGVNPLAAIISGVNEDGTINLFVYPNRAGGVQSRSGVPLKQDDDKHDISPNVSYAEWMPYQKGQAIKTEALEKQLQTVSNEKVDER